MIYLYTHAYNANKTLNCTINSILSQTYQDFVWYLCDNASTDNTREIILSYAEKDKRIIPELRDVNHLHPDYKGIQLFWLTNLFLILEKGNDNDFFCMIDADDEYKPDFFKTMVDFSDRDKLDVAACGSDFINAATGLLIGSRRVKQNLILDSSLKFSMYFGQYHQFMRPVWGKLFRLSLLKRCEYDNYIKNIDIAYGLDTIFSMRAFLRARRVGICSDCLHKYYISLGSSSFNFDSKRIVSDQILDDETRVFLMEKAGKISLENEFMLNAIYYNAVKDTLKVLLLSKISIHEKIIFLKDIMLNDKTRLIFSNNSLERSDLERNLCIPIIQYFLTEQECKKSNNIKIVTEIIMVIYGDLHQSVDREGLEYLIIKIPDILVPLLQKDYFFVLERLRKWFKRHYSDIPSLTALELFACTATGSADEEVFAFLVEIKKERPQSAKTLHIDERVLRITKKYPLLKDMSAELLYTFSSTVTRVMKGEPVQALNIFLSLRSIEIRDNDTEAYILFAQNLSAAAENGDAFVFFQKVWIKYLIERVRVEEAKQKLDEYEQIFPRDEELGELRRRIEKFANSLLHSGEQKMMINSLGEEENFISYVERLAEYSNKYLIILAASDTPCGSEEFTAKVAARLMQVGFTIPLHNKWRCSYAAIIDAGRLIFEGISQTHPVRCEYNLNGTQVKVESMCFDVTGGEKSSKIMINGKLYAKNESRGLSFVVFDKEKGELLDSVNFDTYIADISCQRAERSLLYKAFVARHPGVTFISPSYPAFPISYLSKNEKFIVKYKLDPYKIEAYADTLSTELNKYIDNAEGIREVLTPPKAYIGTHGARRYFDQSGRFLNIVNGHRLTTNQPQSAKRVIYVVGDCNILGIGARDCGTLASHLQAILNEKSPELGFIVENYGYHLDGTNVEKENIAILESLLLKPGDIVVGFGGIGTGKFRFTKKTDNSSELFFDKAHYTEECHRLVALSVFDTLQEHNYFEDISMENQTSEILTAIAEQKNYGLNPVQLELLNAYKSTLATFYEQQFSGAKISPKIGAIVMNCNPFTLGHRYLIEKCAAKVDFLVVFIVQEDKSFFPFEDRIDLVDKGTEDLPNVGVIESGSFIISTLTFTEYFNKSELQDMAVDSSKDVTLFAREIAPAMHISVRFAGSEPFDRVTRQYNDTLALILPKYGIEFEEIPRLEKNREVISASRVRALLKEKDWESIEHLVPQTTLNYLRKNYMR